MKALGILNFVFLLIGIGLLGGAFYLYRNTSNFIDTARKTQHKERWWR